MSAKQTVKEIVDSHNLMHIATLAADHAPYVRGVDYAKGDAENVLYFVTGKDSRKVQHIKSNSKVAVAIDHDCVSWEELSKVKYLNATGSAKIVEDPQEVQKAFGLLMQKFPFMKDLPGDPSSFVVIKVKFEKVVVSDNTKGFMFSETVTY